MQLQARLNPRTLNDVIHSWHLLPSLSYSLLYTFILRCFLFLDIALGIYLTYLISLPEMEIFRIVIPEKVLAFIMIALIELNIQSYSLISVNMGGGVRKALIGHIQFLRQLLGLGGGMGSIRTTCTVGEKMVTQRKIRCYYWQKVEWMVTGQT